jgi:hypothetical protein
MAFGRITALIIQKEGDAITCEADGPDEEGRYIGYVVWWKNGRRHISPLIDAGVKQDSKEEAIASMWKIVDEIRAMKGEIYELGDLA